MTVLKYWDGASGTYKSVSGPPGPPGPSAVSADAGNLARLGSDNLLYNPSTDVGRNKFHNGMFRVQQRGGGSWTSGYGPDRWALITSLDTSSFYLTPFGISGVPGDEEAASALACAVTGNAGAGAYTFVAQFIEGAKRLSGKTITVSFVAYVTSGTAKIGVGLRQFFGTGGSPSAFIDLNAVPVSISTTIQRYSVTIAVPSVAGKTLGSNNDDSTRISFWMSSGATNNNTLAGGIGVQSGTFVFWGMQCEIGSVATPLEKIDIALDRMECMRFYQAGSFYGTNYGGAIGGFWSWSWQLPVTMRGQATLTQNFTTNTNVSGASLAVSAAGPTDSVRMGGTATAVGNMTLIGTFTASADL